MAPKYKVSYFNITGLGEPVRFMLSYLGEDFEDHRLGPDTWPATKPTTPWGKVPVLEENGKVAAQHIAICRYLGKKAGLYGNDSWEELKIDEAVDVINDLRTELAKYGQEKDEKRKADLKGPILNETVPFYMKKLDNTVKENKGYLANGKLSWADLYFTSLCGFLGHLQGSDITASYPNMMDLKEKVLALPKIKSWVERRPKTIF